MDKVPYKYKTICSDSKNGSVLFNRVFEAINANEAEARAFLNCVKAGNKPDSIIVTAKKFSHDYMHL
jgi:hypothetical protein